MRIWKPLLSPSYTPPLCANGTRDDTGTRPLVLHPARSLADADPQFRRNGTRKVSPRSFLPPSCLHSHVCACRWGNGFSPLPVLPPSPDKTGTSPLFSHLILPPTSYAQQDVQGTSPFFLALLPLTRRRPHHCGRGLTHLLASPRCYLGPHHHSAQVPTPCNVAMHMQPS